MRLRILHLGNDFWFRITVIPFIGLLVPYITPIVPDFYKQNSFLSSYPYLYTLLVVIFTFEANRSLLLYFQSKNSANYETLSFDLFKRIMFQLLLTFVLLFFFLNIWYTKVLGVNDFLNLISKNIIIGLIITLIILLIYESSFFLNKWVELMTKSHQIELKNNKSQINLLRNQLAPHFMFNSLGTLMSLIESDKDKAIDFLSTFSKSYRYILSHSEDIIVEIGDELKFVKDYIYIFKSNYGEHSIIEEIDVPNIIKSYKVPTLSIQMLIENALKHNLFSNKMPLKIKIYINQTCTHLIIENEIRYKKSRNSTRLGLESINDRYKLIDNSTIIIEKGDTFKVKLPLIKEEKYASTNN